MNEWESLIGEVDYCHELRESRSPLLDMHKKGMLGNAVLDIGSGTVGVGKGTESPLVAMQLPLKHLVLIDIAVKPTVTEKIYAARMDVHELLDPHDLEGFQQAACCFLNQEGHRPQFSSILLLNIISYIKYQELIPQLLPMLSKRGNLIIGHKKKMGIGRLFSDRVHGTPYGSPSNDELCAYMQSIAHVTHRIFPFPHLSDSSEWEGTARTEAEPIAADEEYMVLCAQKKKDAGVIELPMPIRKLI